MKYTGTFKDINNKTYRVEIISKHDATSSKEIRLLEEPFVSSYSGSDENIYDPIIAGEATVSILTDSPLLDIYSPDATGTSVTLYEGNLIRWKGFVEPLIYDQDWESEQDKLEINCLDAVAILQYIDYDRVDDGSLVCSFEDIFYKIFNLTGINKIHFPNSLLINGDASLAKFKISQHNFYDEDGESMTCLEVIEEVCRFLNYCVIQYHNEIFLLDWDSIKAGEYSCYDGLVNSKTTATTLTNYLDANVINASSYSTSGSTITLSPVYNKVTIKDDLYPVERVFPDLEQDSYNLGGQGHVEVVYTPYAPNTVTKFNHKSYFQFYKSEYITSYYYFMDGDLDNQGTLKPRWDSPDFATFGVNYGRLRRYVGGTYLAHKCEKWEQDKDEPASLSLSNMLLLHCHDKQPTDDKPLFKVNYDNVEFFTGEKTYLVIEGNATFMDDIDDKGDKGVSEMILDTNHSRKKDDFHQDRLFIEVVLKVNNRYWNGSSWLNSYCTFKMPFQFEDKNDDHFIGKSIPIKNTISWRDNIDAKGFKILMPEGVTNSSVEVVFLAPKQRVDNSYRLEAIWIKDFNIEFKVANIDNTNLVTDKEKDTDTEYTNTINETYVKEMDEITFKVCTYDHKTANYSSVYFDSEFVDNVFHKTTKQNLRMEEHLIDRLVTQYSNPSIILNLNLKNDFKPYSTYTTHFFPDKTFVINGSEINWEMNQATLNLMEKK